MPTSNGKHGFSSTQNRRAKAEKIIMLQKDVPCQRILWLTSSYPRFEHDSASIFLRHLAASIQQHKFEIHILSPDHSMVDPSWKNDAITMRRYKYFFPQHLQLLAYGSGILPNLRANRWLFLQAPFFLIAQFISTWRLIRQLKPGLLHAHWLFPQGCVATLLGKWMGIPVIVTVHGGDAFSMQHSVMAKIKRWTVQNCSAWTSNTFATARAVGDNLPSPEIIPMGIDFRQFSAGTAFTRSEDKFVLLFVGRLVQKKGVSDLITAFSLMEDSLKAKSELWIIGDGAEREALKALAGQLKLTDSVTFYGRVPNDQLPDYYATADIFIAPSVIDSSGDTEGQGVILLEALASGTAIISTSAGGIGEVIEHGKTGLLVEPNNPVDLKNAMEQLLRDKVFRDALAATGETIIQAYDWKAIGAKFSRLYHQHLSN